MRIDAMGIASQVSTTQGTDKRQTVTTSAAELGQIAADVEAFLQMWVARLEKVLDQCAPSAADEASLQQRKAEFESARRHWDEERQRDLQQIQETTEQLSAAWERLEEEQRRVLQSPASNPRRAPHGESPQSDPMGTPTDIPQTQEAPATLLEAPSAGESRSGAAASAARDRAVRQFHRLRRQIQIPPT